MKKSSSGSQKQVEHNNHSYKKVTSFNTNDSGLL